MRKIHKEKMKRMERIIFYGVGPQAEDIVRECWGLLWNTLSIQAVVFNDAAHWGTKLGGVEIKRPADLASFVFDRIIICGTFEFAVPIRQLLVEKLGLGEEQVVWYREYMKFNVAEHKIDWENVIRTSDIIEGLQQADDLSDLEKYYYNSPHREIEKYAHYFEIYDRHFQKFRGKKCTVVEVGVFKGGSLQMWKNYFGKDAQIIGIDIEESVKAFEEEQVSIEIGSQEDRDFWKRFKNKYPQVDVFIDDGGHTMNQQIVTFEEMFPHVSENGVYLCEDMHTSYWERYGGGYQNPESFVEYSKNFIDYINAWYSNANVLENTYTQSMHSLHYYDSVLVIEKRKMYRAVSIHMGDEE